MPDMTRESWNDIVAELPNAHVLQTWEWGAVKERFGWQPAHKVWRDNNDRIDASALVLTRSASIGRYKLPVRVMYVPRGPLLRNWHDHSLRIKVFDGLRDIARRNKATFIKIDPEVEHGRGKPADPGARHDQRTETVTAELTARGWRYSQDQVQFKNTVTVDLHPSPDEMLARMKQKTRYNIRLATRKGVGVRVGNLNDLDLLYQMYAETSLRDGFLIRHKDYYQTVWSSIIQAGAAEPLIAEVDGEPVAALIIFRFANRAWYMYGMSRLMHREKMPNYVLQWQAMLRAKHAGCTSYDLWGAPDEFNESDPMWGVYRFKEGLGGDVVRYIGAWDLPINSLMYRSYTQLLPRVLSQLRSRGIKQTQGAIQAG